MYEKIGDDSLRHNGAGYKDMTAYQGIINAMQDEKVKVTFVIPGEPVAKERPRRGVNGRWYTPKKTKDFEDLCSLAYGNRHYFEDDYLKVSIIFQFKIPSSFSRVKRGRALKGLLRPSKKDIDNCIKSILDGLNKTAWDDDNKVVEISATKIYGEKSEIIVTIENL